MEELVKSAIDEMYDKIASRRKKRKGAYVCSVPSGAREYLMEQEVEESVRGETYVYRCRLTPFAAQFVRAFRAAAEEAGVEITDSFIQIRYFHKSNAAIREFCVDAEAGPDFEIVAEEPCVISKKLTPVVFRYRLKKSFDKNFR